MASPAAHMLLFLVMLLASPMALSMEEKIVYHLHTIQSDTFKRAINNLENLKKGMSEREIDIKVVMQGNSIRLLNPLQRNEKLWSRFVKLRDSGVDIEVSRNNFNENKTLIEDGFNPTLFDNVFSRLVELQRQGYRYITP